MNPQGPIFHDPSHISQTEFIESVLSLKPRVAAFDCDGTLWSEDAGEGFFHWEVELEPEKRLLPEPIVQWVRPRHVDYKAGRVEEDTMCGEMVRCTADCGKK